MASIFIADGYTLNGRIEGLRGVYPPLKFKYRPALPARVYTYMQEGVANGEAKTKAVVDLLAEHLVSWDVAEEISERNLRRVYQPLLFQLVEHVTGYASVDAEADAKNSATASGSH